MKVVVVKFLDATTFDYWASKEDVLKTEPKVCIATGVLVRKDKHLVTVALLSPVGTERSREAYSNWINIPACCVLSCKEGEEIDG